MERKYFGTDGIRGTANEGQMTVDVAMRVGQAAGHVFKQKSPHKRPTVVIGKDTRLSGYMIESALQAGFTSVGFYCLLVGPMPTPAVAYLTKTLRADLGVMISASHNPFEDNGIKLFGPDGFKLPDEMELEIESLMDDVSKIEMASAKRIGKAVRIEDAVGRYIEFCKAAVSSDLSLDGLKIVVDCAHGAAYKIAPKVLWELGADVIRVGAEPDGMNINDGVGALHPEVLGELVVKHEADLGIALDGDADRLILCDEKGQVIDGDQTMATVATYMHEQGLLKGNGIVATQMSNMGLEKYLQSLGLSMVRSKVGDRYVMEDIKAGGYNFGGEASGHLILLDHATTGDGTLAALKFIEVMKKRSKKASEITGLFKPFPQKLQNVRLPEKELADVILGKDEVKAVIEQSEKVLNGNGRVLIRKSGTEPLIRVMVEAESISDVDAHVFQISKVIEEQV